MVVVVVVAVAVVAVAAVAVVAAVVVVAREAGAVAAVAVALKWCAEFTFETSCKQARRQAGEQASNVCVGVTCFHSVCCSRSEVQYIKGCEWLHSHAPSMAHCRVA